MQKASLKRYFPIIAILVILGIAILIFFVLKNLATNTQTASLSQTKTKTYTFFYPQGYTNIVDNQSLSFYKMPGNSDNMAGFIRLVSTQPKTDVTKNAKADCIVAAKLAAKSIAGKIQKLHLASNADSQWCESVVVGSANNTQITLHDKAVWFTSGNDKNVYHVLAGYSSNLPQNQAKALDLAASQFSLQ